MIVNCDRANRGQNLDRATVQLTLAEAIRTERGRWEALVRDTFGSGSA